VILAYVVGELQGGVGTLAAVREGIRADYFINSEPTDLQALTMHAAAFIFTIELTGVTRHMSKREEAVDAIRVACELVPELTAMTFSDAPTEAHRSINRVHVGTIRGALGRNFEEWRPPQVADFVRLTGSGRHGSGQSEAQALADFRAVLDRLETRFPGLKAEVRIESRDGRPTMPAFEVPKEARIVRALNAAYEAVRGSPQPTGVITSGLLRHRREPPLRGRRDGGRRLRSGRALQHDAGRTGGSVRLPGHDPDLPHDDVRHLRAGARLTSRCRHVLLRWLGK
jgi:acetylornithine deacetylase